jgi:hypothetical protein
LNHSPHSPYNARMASRPQFSLRMLLFVAVMVCLAAATVNEPPVNRKLVANAQALLRVVLGTMFPAMLVAGAIRAKGYFRTFFIGGLFAALAPSTMACFLAYFHFGNASEVGLRSTLKESWQELTQYRQIFAISWLFIPVAALACLAFHRVLCLGDAGSRGKSTLSQRQFVRRLSLVTAVAICLVAATIPSLPVQHRLANLAQILLRITIFIVFPAVLTTGVVQGHGYFRIFCLGCLLPSAIGFQTMCEVATAMATMPVGLLDWSPRDLILWSDDQNFDRYFALPYLALAPLVGFAGVFFYWLLRPGQTTAE